MASVDRRAVGVAGKDARRRRSRSWGAPAGPARQTGRVTTRVFLLDDHEVVRRGLRELLEAEGDMVVVGEAGTAEEAYGRIPATRSEEHPSELQSLMRISSAVFCWHKTKN